MADDTVREIWAAIGGLLPQDARPEHLLFRYTFDERLNFLGGPYTPMVTVELYTSDAQDASLPSIPAGVDPMPFRFVHPLGGLIAMATGSAPATRGGITFPPMGVSLPGEDLGEGGFGATAGSTSTGSSS
jgi:hypothetical protein